MAGVTADFVLDRVRNVLKDNPALSANRRWSDTELCYWLTEAVRETVDRRSDMYSVNDAEYTGLAIPAIAALGAASDVHIHSSNVHILVDYVLARAFAKDAEDGDLNLSNTYMTSYYTKLGVKP